MVHTSPRGPSSQKGLQGRQETSLNNELLQGPNLTSSLLGVLTRFRQEPVACMGDIQAMFYQVKVAEEDRDFLTDCAHVWGRVLTQLRQLHAKENC